MVSAGFVLIMIDVITAWVYFIRVSKNGNIIVLWVNEIGFRGVIFGDNIIWGMPGRLSKVYHTQPGL